MASARGMTLDEAASGGPAPERPEPREKRPRTPSGQAKGMARAAQMMDGWIRADKARRDAAMEEARSRGLDAEERRKAEAEAHRAQRRNNRRRDPKSHARVLLSETSLPMTEISSITGLDMYEIVGMKLKMREAARSQPG